MKYIRILSVSSWCLPLSSIRQVARAIPWSSWEGDRVGGHRKILKILAVKHGGIISSHGGLVYYGKINELFCGKLSIAMFDLQQVQCLSLQIRPRLVWKLREKKKTQICSLIAKKLGDLPIYIYSIYYIPLFQVPNPKTSSGAICEDLALPTSPDVFDTEPRKPQWWELDTQIQEMWKGESPKRFRKNQLHRCLEREFTKKSTVF